MKVLKEIGYRKTIRFFLYSIVDLILPLFFLPQLKKSLLSVLGSKISNNSVILKVNFFNWHHTGPKGFSVGKDCYIGDQTLIDLYDQVILEDQVTIGQKVTIITHLNVGYKTHPLQKYFPKFSKPVIIKNGTVIGASSTVLPGVTIGERSFVAAGSVVTESIPDRSLVAGVPAKVKRKIK